MQKPKFIMIHHSAVSYTLNADQFEANNNYHKAQWNFKSSMGFYLGYNYEIAKSGLKRQARQDGEQTAACYQANMNSGQCVHVCLDGNFDIEKPTPEQIYALRDLLKQLVKSYGINKDNIVFHSAYAQKTCPGKNMDIMFVRSLVSSNVFKK
ncbi:MAG: peptidoglycan recognition family protein [bacterium]